MPIIPAPTGVPPADEDSPFDVSLALADTEQLLVAVPTGKFGRAISLQNDGPGSVFISFDSPASLTSLEIKRRQTYSESDIEVATDVRFIGETGKTPSVHGVLWSGPSA